ncbi:MAG TPA: 2-dehydropantoate 2-reductase [Solirubrobacteraceae bacterium]|nr:2-dehydropantoate 2-reductase [Solirubrobacteraceae bacterium]
MKIAVLGPGGVGGLIAGLLERAGTPVLVVAREATAEAISERGLRVDSVTFGQFVVHPRAVVRLEEPVDVLIVATKASGLEAALGRIVARPKLVLPLLNGLDHIAVLRERFGEDAVLAGTIRVEADRPEPGVVVHTSPFLLVDMASHDSSPGEGDPAELAGDRPGDRSEVDPRAGMEALARLLKDAGVSVRAQESDAQVMWSKLVRLNALACTTSAFDKRLGEIRSTPELRAALVGAIEEGCAVGQAEGAEDVDPATALGELELAHDSLGSSMQRDIDAGRAPELDAIPGSVLRAAARHGIPCPTIERLVATIADRAGVSAPVIAR